MRTAQENRFRSWDGTELFYRHWAAVNNAPTTRAVILLHRGHEHSGRWQNVVNQLQLPNFAFFAWDA